MMVVMIVIVKWIHIELTGSNTFSLNQTLKRFMLTCKTAA